MQKPCFYKWTKNYIAMTKALGDSVLKSKADASLWVMNPGICNIFEMPCMLHQLSSATLLNQYR